MSIEERHCVDREIDCSNCGNELTLLGDISQVEQWMEGICMKCGWTIYTTTDFLGLDQVNQWRDCQEEEYVLTSTFIILSSIHQNILMFVT